MKLIVLFLLATIFSSCELSKYGNCEENINIDQSVNCPDNLNLGITKMADILKRKNIRQYDSYKGSDEVCVKVFYEHSNPVIKNKSFMQKSIFYFNREILYRVRTRVVDLENENILLDEEQFKNIIKSDLCPLIWKHQDNNGKILKELKFGKTEEGMSFFEYDIKIFNSEKIEKNIDVPLH